MKPFKILFLLFIAIFQPIVFADTMSNPAYPVSGTGNYLKSNGFTASGANLLGDYGGFGSINAANIFRVTGSGGFAGSIQVGITSAPTGTSAGTSQLIGLASLPGSAAASYTVTDLIGVKADTNTKGAGSTVTNSTGLYINDQTVGANNYGLRGLVSSGSSKYNLYLDGTAQNYLQGSTYIGYTTDQGGGEKIQVNGNALIAGTLKSTHLIGSTSSPTIAAGTGAGTSPTISVTGNDTDMQVTVTTGTTPAGTNATIATITYNATFGTTPHPTFSPANAAADTLSGANGVFMDGASATTFTITSGTTALLASTTYKWNVHTMN